uniref:Odorant receptor n=1 Tax=Takifugu rubripes TaxID=31033 RepID=Q2PQZ7_TAKRU|nr:odorant receptor [Takifugu rubripes]
MALSQVLYILAACLIKMSYPVCGILSVVGVLTSDISPLTLVVMSLERYVAVCYPLRHADVITIRNTVLMIFVIWAFSLLSGLIRVSLVDYPELESLQMEEFCSSITLFVGPLSDTYDKANTCFLFVSAGLAIAFSYIGVTVAARSASTDKTSAQKARNTLLLHLVQLGLSLSSTVYKPVLTALSRIVTRIVLIRVQIVLYVWFFILPRCLSALIYGIRDQLIRPVLFYHLCCRLNYQSFRVKATNRPFLQTLIYMYYHTCFLRCLCGVRELRVAAVAYFCLSYPEISFVTRGNIFPFSEIKQTVMLCLSQGQGQ